MNNNYPFSKTNKHALKMVDFAFKGIKLIDGQVLTIMQPVTMAEGRDWLVITFYFVTYCKINEPSMESFEEGNMISFLSYKCLRFLLTMLTEILMEGYKLD